MNYRLEAYIEEKVIREKYQEKNNNNYKGDLGFDLLFPDEYIVKKGEKLKINLKIIIQIKRVKDNKYQAFMLLPRSSITETDLILVNSIGVIDSNFRGQLRVVVRNMGDEDFLIKEHSSLFQVILFNGEKFNYKFIKENELSSSERGENGFGSTNTRT